MIRNILFDLDGTLTDSADGITRCIENAVNAVGGSAPPRDEIVRFIGTPLRNIFATLLDTADRDRIATAIDLYRERFDRVGYAENRVYDGIRESLSGLRERGYSLFVATAKRQADAERIVGHFGLVVHFDEVFGVRTDRERDDKAVLVGRILADCGIEAQTAAMIGDRSHDIRAAHSAQLRAVGAGWGYGTHEELRHAGAHSIVATPDGILREFPRL